MKKEKIEKVIREVISRDILIDGEAIPSDKSLLSLPVDHDDWSCLLIPALIEEFNLNVDNEVWSSAETISEISDLILHNISARDTDNKI